MNSSFNVKHFDTDINKACENTRWSEKN